MRADAPQLRQFQVGIRSANQRKVNRNLSFRHDRQGLTVRQSIQRRVHPAFHRVLDRHHRAVGLTGAHHPQRILYPGGGQKLHRIGGFPCEFRQHLARGLFAEGPKRPQERHSQRSDDAGTGQLGGVRGLRGLDRGEVRGMGRGEVRGEVRGLRW